MGLLAFFVTSIFILQLAPNTMSLPVPRLPPLPFPLPFFTPPPPPMISPPPASVKSRTVRCRSPLFPFCTGVSVKCPRKCPTTCMMDCAVCKPVCSCNFPGAVCQDPRFVGGDGNTFYFHGRKNRDFCLVSDGNLHINGHFIGKRNPNLKRDFTWVQSIGVMLENHKLFIAAERTSTWDDNVDRLSISFDGNQISLPTHEGSKWDYQKETKISITRTSSTNGIILEVMNNFRVTAIVVPITAEDSRIHGYGINVNEDCFAHLELGFKFFNLTDEVDGVLGQTYRRNYVSKTKVNVPMPVMGGEHRYSTTGLFATDCAVSRFRGAKAIVKNRLLLHDHHPTFKCKNGRKGNGLVCK